MAIKALYGLLHVSIINNNNNIIIIIHSIIRIYSKLCENSPPFGRRVSTQFLVFPISTRVDITVQGV
jgi:hypothetical protein